ncbi:hypothetical protein DFQ03_2836 [Maribacter caenipelagi]|uniref:Uncharacterized protein n=1 Tax=Maribacter caenipelagi TaxID=1447781 RepID=A0A4R7CY84_9FLAO|nr:hypothetical protein [Maribacter caenipelagi]TDS13543.1 hypothetical protein DFQ03_2836 [Maribacter caenipelagi]
MGYKVFYSFQTDINSKLNLGFIKNAIKKAIRNIKEFDIEPLIDGFGEVGGNPPLLETMLKHSSNADVFIGDVTFTSSKIWQSKGVSFHDDGKQILIEIDKPISNLKPAPNPNVLIETGYSWGLKNFDRTILVMNTAFGEPEMLPVDMKGLRYPITYNLSEERANQSDIKSEEQKNLVKAFEIAIRNSIKSSINHQSDILSPLQLYTSLAEISRPPYILIKTMKKIIKRLRLTISKDDKPIRIIAPAKSGKSRLLFELFRKNDDLEEITESKNRMVYHDYNGALDGDIAQKLDILKKRNIDTILILDNCPEHKIESLEELFMGSRIKLITTSINSQNSRNEIIITKGDQIDMCTEILETKFSYNKSVELANKLNGNIKMAILNLSDKISFEGQTSSLELIKQEIGKGNVGKGAVELLTNISLFKYIGIKNGHEHDLNVLLKIFYPDTKPEEVKQILDLLIEHKLINRKGDFIQVNTDDEELTYEWWKDIDSTKIDQIHNLESNSLFYRLIDKLLKTHKRIPIPSLEHNLFGNDKFLTKNNFYETSIGQKFLNDFAHIFPEKVLNLSESIVKKHI